MEKLYLTLIIGMLRRSIVGAGLIFDSYREVVISKEDTAVLTRAGITDYQMTQKDMGNSILVFMGNEVTSQVVQKEKKVCDTNVIISERKCTTETKTEKEIQDEITNIENSWLQRQKDSQLAKETTPTKAPEVKTTELVTITEAKLIDEIGGGVVRLK